LLAGAPGWSVVWIAAIATLGFVVTAWSGELPKARWVDAWMLLMLSWTALQAVPLPRGLISWFSPIRLELRGESEDAWVPLSLDPAGTWEQLVVGAAIVASYFTGRFVAHRHGRRAALYVAASSPLVVALVSFGHALAGVDRVYGWYAPVHAAPALLGPVLNNNHLGGFLAFGAVLFVGLALATSHRARRVILVVCGAVCGLGALAAVSRGAVLSLVVGLLGVVAVAYLTKRAGRSRGRSGWIWVATTTAIAMVGGGAYLGLDGLFADFEKSDFSKLEIARSSMSLAFEMPFAGVGRGAFGAVFSQIDGTGRRFTHPENIVGQWVSEWGIAAFAAALVFAGALLRSAKSSRIEVAVASVAVVALVAHEMVDFALEMPGLVPVVAFVFGVIAGGGNGATERAVPAGAARAVAIGSVAVAIVLGVGVESRRPEAYVARLQHAASDPRVELDALVSDAVDAHPLDAGVALYVAHALLRREDGRAVRWLNRAMVLAPGWASPHVLAADLLDRQGARGQALVEIREAETRQPGSAREVLCRIGQTSNAEAIAFALPSDPEVRGRLVDALSRCLPNETAAQLDEISLGERPTLGALVRRAERRRQQDPTQALVDLETAARLAPDREDVHVARARILLDREGPEVALAVLPERPVTWSGTQLRAQLAALVGDDEEVERQLSRLRSQAAGSSTRLAQAWAAVGQIEERRDNLGAAAQAYERAHRLDPDAPGHLANVARLAERLGQLRRALSANGELCRLGLDQGCRARQRLMGATP
jgi:tetratricopeptide (TPR) repeat protein